MIFFRLNVFRLVFFRLIESAECFFLLGGVSVWVVSLLGCASAGWCFFAEVCFHWVRVSAGWFFLLCGCFLLCFPDLSFFRCVVFQMCVFQMCFSDVFLKCLFTCFTRVFMFSCVFSCFYFRCFFSDVCFFDVWFRRCVVSLMRFLFQMCFFSDVCCFSRTSSFLLYVVFFSYVWFFCCLFFFFFSVFLFFPDVVHSFGVLDRCFLIGVFMCVCFQECFDIDLIGDLLCDFDW